MFLMALSWVEETNRSIFQVDRYWSLDFDKILKGKPSCVSQTTLILFIGTIFYSEDILPWRV